MQAVGIVSGGLDSLLAIRMVQNMKYDVTVLHFVCGFETFHIRNMKRGQGLKIPNPILQSGATCILKDIRTEFLEILSDPPHGYGKCLNPCIDCKILMLKEARKTMESQNADFVFTGEVLGQRPMSQHKQSLDLITKESGLGNRLLRPLSGALLPPTEPETAGLISRVALETIQGRSRNRQLELAGTLGIEEFPTPAGGCLLTDPGYTNRIKNLLKYRPDNKLDLDDPVLLSLGRHFTLPHGATAVVGRNQEENEIIERFGSKGILLEATEVNGPTTLLLGMSSTADLQICAQLTAAFGKGKNDPQVEMHIIRPGGTKTTLHVAPNPPDECELIT